MNYKVKTIPHFDKAIKRLAKKFASLKSEYISLIDSLEKSPEQGIAIGYNCYKIRISIASKGNGKRGGARIITYVFVTDKTVFLLDIYDKSEQANITNKELEQLIREIK
ncbi:MAG: type II toxin-antitoxin system RelE/ParE family toxin [Chitinophagaceae bacterium]|nr:type II toxin-antitoxin system RelE/ParE family toxin [Chitinophagaceae bacterium]